MEGCGSCGVACGVHLVSDIVMVEGKGMIICSECSKQLVKFEDKPYTCSYCGGTFCIDHHLPENHVCNMVVKNMFEGLKEKPKLKKVKI